MRVVPFDTVTYPEATRQERATKGDIQDLRIIVTEQKFDLLKWIIGLSLGQIGLMIGILLKLSH